MKLRISQIISQASLITIAVLTSNINRKSAEAKVFTSDELVHPVTTSLSIDHANSTSIPVGLNSQEAQTFTVGEDKSVEEAKNTASTLAQMMPMPNQCGSPSQCDQSIPGHGQPMPPMPPMPTFPPMPPIFF